MSLRSFRAATALMVVGTFAAAQGDDCTTATALVGGGAGVVQTTPIATTGFAIAGPIASCNGFSDTNDGFYAFLATMTGTATFATCGTSAIAPGGGSGGVDTYLAVYDGAGGCPITGAELGCNDDGGGCAGPSEVTVAITAGNTYYVQVGDWAAGGPITGTLAYVENASAAPPNDVPAGALLQVGPGTIVDDNSTSVIDGPLSATCGLPSDDLWYYYIPTISGILFATTCPSAGGLTGNAFGVPNGDTIITAFADAGGAPGAELGCNDDFASCTGGVGNGFESLMSVPVTAGVGIYLSVCGWGGPGAGGAYVLDLTEGSALANDECTGAVALLGGPAGGTTNVGLTNIGSTASLDQGTCYGQPEPDAWFVYVPVTTGVVEFSTCSLDCDAGLICGNPGTMGNHNISVWSGTCGALTQTECNSQDWRNNFACNGGQACRAQVQCTAGTPIYVAVAGFLGSQGVFDLHVEEFASAPGNTCANAIPLLGTGTFFIDTTSDGIAPDGVNPSCNPVGDINGNYTGAWFAWTAPCTGTVSFNTCQTTGFFGGNDTVIMVYDACGGVEIACDDNAFANECGFGNTLASATSFAATAGSTYFLSVGGWQGNKGPITFTLDYNYRHVWTTTGVGDIQLENVEGPGNALAFSAITLDLVHPGLPPAQTFPNGWFFGVPMGFPELFQQITWPGGLPFTGILDPCGYLFNFALPAGTTSGLAGLATIWSVGVAFDPLTGFATVNDTTAPTAFPL